MKRILALLLVSLMVVSAFGALSATAAPDHRDRDKDRDSRVIEVKTVTKITDVDKNRRIWDPIKVAGTVKAKESKDRDRIVDAGKVAVLQKVRHERHVEWKVVAVTKVDDGKFKATVKLGDRTDRDDRVTIAAAFLGATVRPDDHHKKWDDRDRHDHKVVIKFKSSISDPVTVKVVKEERHDRDRLDDRHR